MTRRTLDIELPDGSKQTTEFHVKGESPRDPSILRVEHAEVSVEIQSDIGQFFDGFSRFVQYDRWAPDVQGSAHWLTIRDGGLGSKFIAYDKPGETHLVHYGEVTKSISLQRKRANIEGMLTTPSVTLTRPTLRL